MANILVYIELADDSASWASLLALRQARYLATNVGATIYAVLPCATPPLYGENDIIAILSRQGADKVILMTHGDLTPPMLFQSHGEALLTAAGQFPPALLLLPEGPAGVEIAPRVAARLGGLFVRHPRIDVQENSSFRIDQPVFDDTHVRRFDSAELEHTVVAVVAPDPQQYAQALGTEEAEVVVIAPSFSDAEPAARPTRVEGQQGDGRPQRIVLVGAGVTETAEVEAIRQLAELLKADLRVTQTALDKAVLTAPLMVEPPLVCSPDLVVAFGVHGSPETLACLSNFTYLVGVNTDEKAPLFQRAQLGLVAPALETAQQMVADAKAHPDEPLLPVPEEEPQERASEDAREDGEQGKDKSLIDTLLPSKKADDSRTSAPTEEMEPALADTVKETREEAAARSQTAAAEPKDAKTAPSTEKVNLGVAAKIRPIDQLAHTPPMGTPMSIELQEALDAAGAPTTSQSGEDAGAVSLGGHDPTPAPTDVASDITPEASPAGVVADGQDAALDDTVPAPLPGSDGKPSAGEPPKDEPADKPKDDNSEGQEP